jgi:hypothetical protein
MRGGARVQDEDELAAPACSAARTFHELGELMSSSLAVTIYGVCAVTFMMVMYALEARSRWFVVGFAAGCALSSVYGFLAGAWPFGVVEAIWAVVAVRRFVDAAPTPTS